MAYIVQKILAGVLNFVYPENRILISISEETLAEIPHAVMTGLVEPDIHAVWRYRTPLVRSLIWKLKYRGSHAAAEIGGKAMGKYIQEKFAAKFDRELDAADAGDGPIYLIPIPLSPKRLRERGYNQSEWLAQAIAKMLSGGSCARVSYFGPTQEIFEKLGTRNIAVRTDILKRINYKERQTHKNRSGRIQNAANTFAICKSIASEDRPKIGVKPEIADATCIVIDDVVTTGSTFVAARRILLAAGARRVICVAVAH